MGVILHIIHSVNFYQCHRGNKLPRPQLGKKSLWIKMNLPQAGHIFFASDAVVGEA